MSYRKRYYKKRRYRRSRGRVRRYRRQRYGYFGKFGTHVGGVWKAINQLRGLINVEFKWDNKNHTISPDTSGQFHLLNGFTKGDGVHNREGRKVLIKRYNFRVESTIHASASATYVRYIVFIDRQTDSSEPTAGMLLTDSTDIDSFRNPDWGKRFQVLFDKTQHMDSDDDPQRRCSKYLRLNFHTQYKSTDTGLIADISRNPMYLYALSSEATNVPSVKITSRIFWIDN